MSFTASDAATNVMHHILEMYPALWKVMGSSAKQSIRNTVIRQCELAIELHDPWRYPGRGDPMPEEDESVLLQFGINGKPALAPLPIRWRNTFTPTNGMELLCWMPIPTTDTGIAEEA